MVPEWDPSVVNVESRWENLSVVDILVDDVPSVYLQLDLLLVETVNRTCPLSNKRGDGSAVVKASDALWRAIIGAVCIACPSSPALFLHATKKV